MNKYKVVTMSTDDLMAGSLDTEFGGGHGGYEIMLIGQTPPGEANPGWVIFGRLCPPLFQEEQRVASPEPPPQFSDLYFDSPDDIDDTDDSQEVILPVGVNLDVTHENRNEVTPSIGEISGV